MRREWPVQEMGTPARAEMRLTARVTESGTSPPVMWPCRSMPTNAGVDGSVQRSPCSATRRSR